MIKYMTDRQTVRYVKVNDKVSLPESDYLLLQHRLPPLAKSLLSHWSFQQTPTAQDESLTHCLQHTLPDHLQREEENL